MSVAASGLERSFVLQALAAQVRTDERSLGCFREIAFAFEHAQRGSVTASLGGTKVLAVTTATLARPYPDRPAEGLVGFHVSLSACSVPVEDYPEVEEGEGGRLQRLIDRIFKNNRVVDTESLCLVPGEQVWSVRVDIHVLDHDGNLVDAAAAAALASLLDYRRPDVTISEGGVHVHSFFEKNPVPLALHNPPVAVSFALFDPQSAATDHATKQQSCMVAVADPTWIEERVGGSGRLTMALNRHGELAMVVKSGGEATEVELIQSDCVLLAKARAVSVLDTLHVAIARARSK